MRKVLALLFIAATLIALGCDPGGLEGRSWTLFLHLIAGGGTVRIEPDEKVKTECDADCDRTLPQSVDTTLTAIPYGAYEFVRFEAAVSAACEIVPEHTGNPSVVSLTKDNHCVAEFKPKDGTIQLTVEVVGLGAVTTTPAGVGACEGSSDTISKSCDGMYVANTNVLLAAQPMPGWGFRGWSNGCSGQDPLANVVLETPITCTATFVPASASVVAVSAWSSDSHTEIVPPKVAEGTRFDILLAVQDPIAGTYLFSLDPPNPSVAELDLLGPVVMGPIAYFTVTSLHQSYDFHFSVTDPSGAVTNVSFHVDRDGSQQPMPLNVSVRPAAEMSTPTHGLVQFAIFVDETHPLGEVLQQAGLMATAYTWELVYEGPEQDQTATVDCANPSGFSYCVSYPNAMADVTEGERPMLDFTQAGWWRVKVRLMDSSMPPRMGSSLDFSLNVR